ncbi:hypothetical protein [Micromonospora halophytica]|uniref:Polymorphic outer membrane protein repeat-containing protein n=2 Tax=Micromonospora halophytica TaxID=47864 RepID=A0A1C5JAJ5_9ACTN|nr:hypothetical protein [Micromonospora halophytica]SCG67179.1 hypothetical protein GA0070560_1251 [Micromonospora halophytica]
MSNDVTTPDGGAPMAAPAKKRRALWVAGVAGLSGVVGLAALGGIAARDDKADGTQRVSEVQSATAQQKASGTGTADVGSGEEEDKKAGQDPGEGYDRQDAAAASGGKQWRGKDGRGEDEYGPARQLPCDSDVLVEAVNRANEDNGGVFRLAKDCDYKLTEQTATNAFPAIDERIVLLGHNSKLVHDGSELFRFFEVLSGGELILKDLTLRGGQVTSPPPLQPNGANGGALFVQEGGRAVLKHTKLVDNRATGVGATGGNGGAIYNLGDVEIHKSVLADNHARGTGTPGGNGGAIYNEGTLAVHDSELADNTATSTGTGGNGGAIANRDNGRTTVTHSQILNNKATHDGGGIETIDTAHLTVIRTKLAGNVAGDDGGAISTNGNSVMSLEYVVVADNKATDNGGGIEHDSTSIATVKHAKFLDNTAGDNGGGLYNDETLNLFDTEFKGNHAEEGGAIYNDNNNGVLTVRKSTIIYNFAAETGSPTTGAGGIFNDNNTNDVTIDDKTIIRNNEPRNCVNVTGCAN